jgi:hypothetical protein
MVLTRCEVSKDAELLVLRHEKPGVVKLQVRLLVRTLSVAVRGARRFASLPPRTYSGQGQLFTHLKIEFDQVSSHPDDWEETVCKCATNVEGSRVGDFSDAVLCR